ELEWPSVPVFKGNIGSPRGPRILVDGKNDYDGLDFHVHKPGEFFATVTLRVTDEEGKPVEGIGAGLSNGQNVYAARGKQFSGASGKFFAEDIWPTDQPVRITLYSRGTEGPYAIWAVASKPFVVESKGRYHFDLVLPSSRSVVIQVVSPKNQPLEGIKVIAFSKFPVKGDSFRFPRSTRTVQTDIEGQATIDLPRREVFVRLTRTPISTKPTRPVASAVIPVRIPKIVSAKPITLVFDDRPILIEGILESPVIPDGEKLAAVYCTKDGLLTHLGCSSTVKNGRFKLQGPPAGQVRLGYATYNPSTSKRILHNKDCQGELEVEPGFAYAVKIIGDRLEVIRKSKLEEKKP
ncbi:hypothetical protein LCGC14_2790330, partial [marine sediment metagenome]